MKIKKDIINFSIAVLLFIVASYFVQTNIELVESYLFLFDGFGIVIYFLILVIFVILAPATDIFLIPIAANIWGFVNTSLITIAGWSVGSLIAFFIAQRYGQPIVRKLISLESIYAIEKRMPQEGKFWSIVAIRLIFPFDVINYALGLFTKVRPRVFFFATVISVTPYAFLISYLGTLPLYYQIFGVLIGLMIGLVTLIFYLILKKRKRNY